MQAAAPLFACDIVCERMCRRDSALLTICGGSALAEKPFARGHDPVGDRSFRPRPNRGERSQPGEGFRQGASEWQDPAYRSSVHDDLLSDKRMYTVAAACGATVFAASVATADHPCWWALPAALGTGMLVSPPLRRVVGDAANGVMSSYMDSAYRQRAREGEHYHLPRCCAERGLASLEICPAVPALRCAFLHEAARKKRGCSDRAIPSPAPNPRA